MLLIFPSISPACCSLSAVEQCMELSEKETFLQLPPFPRGIHLAQIAVPGTKQAGIFISANCTPAECDSQYPTIYCEEMKQIPLPLSVDFRHSGGVFLVSSK